MTNDGQTIEELETKIAELESKIEKLEADNLGLRHSNDFLQYSIDSIHNISKTMCSEYMDKLRSKMQDDPCASCDCNTDTECVKNSEGSDDSFEEENQKLREALLVCLPHYDDSIQMTMDIQRHHVYPDDMTPTDDHIDKEIQRFQEYAKLVGYKSRYYGREQDV